MTDARLDEIIARNSLLPDEYNVLFPRVPHRAVFWPVGEHSLKHAQNLASLEDIAGQIGGASKLLVVGRASRDGDARFNRRLAGRRALELKAHLAKRFHRSPDDIVVLVFGEETRYLDGRDRVVRTANLEPSDYGRSQAVLNRSAWVFAYKECPPMEAVR